MQTDIAFAARALARDADDLGNLARTANRARELASASPDLSPPEWAEHHGAAESLVVRIADEVMQQKLSDVIWRTKSLITAAQVQA